MAARIYPSKKCFDLLPEKKSKLLKPQTNSKRMAVSLLGNHYMIREVQIIWSLFAERQDPAKP